MRRLFLYLWILLGVWLIPTLSSALTPPPAEQVFIVSAKLVDKQTLHLQWTIKPGFYLYKDRFQFKTEDSAITFQEPQLPPGIQRQNEFLGDYEVYADTVTLPLTSQQPMTTPFILHVTYQGCAESGFCYPPLQKTFTVTPLSVDSSASTDTAFTWPNLGSTSSTPSMLQILNHANPVWTLLSCLGIGILLSLTPCVFPILPILSGIILGQKKLDAIKALGLSSAYVLGMATTYAIIGVIAALAGYHLQSLLQTPWILGITSAILIFLALALFNTYSIQLPLRWRTWLAQVSEKQPRGTYLGVFIMGSIASLIVSPCVTPPLIGTLGYISQTGNTLLGGAALFMLGIGMGLPLILLATTGGKYLPKAGRWMNTIKNILGILLLFVALELLSRFLSGYLTMLLWGVFIMTLGIYLGAFRPFHTPTWQHAWQGLGLALVVYGIFILLGASMGNTHVLTPLANPASQPSRLPPNTPTFFQTVTSLPELQQALANARHNQQPTIVDVYADWCLSCKKMAVTTFADPSVQAVLTNYYRIKVDVTANDDKALALMRYLDVIAPPALLFFNQEGQELAEHRLVGEVSAKDLVKHLQNLTS